MTLIIACMVLRLLLLAGPLSLCRYAWSRSAWIIILAALGAGHGVGVLAAEPARPLKRARPPVWSADVLDAFFEDAREKLEGERPDYDKMVAAVSEAVADSVTASAGFVWSTLIEATTIETEIKRVGQSLDRAVSTPTEFKGGGYKAARRDFSLLAVLFAVIGQYDGPARWQDAAAGLRDLFARAGYNAKVGTDQTYREAVQRNRDLAELVRGGRPQLPRADLEVNWRRVADRPPLMERLNAAHEERLTKWLSGAASFRRHRDDVRHEAQVMAIIAEIISRDGFDFWDDEEYAGYARDLRQAAMDLAAADDFERARQAVGRATAACTGCHEGYR